MKESAQIALGYIKSNHQQYNISYDLITENNIHIHVPEGAVKKDGPSAGIALTTAMISVLGKYEIPHDVAMTGEITLRGRVLAIGGLKEKSIGALRNGIKKIIIPEGNIVCNMFSASSPLSIQYPPNFPKAFFTSSRISSGMKTACSPEQMIP